MGGGGSLLQWIVDSYTLVFAALLLSMGSACDIFGARRVYLLGLAVFVIFSVGCAVAPTGNLLIASRALQGVGAAALVPGSLALLSASITDPSARARAIGTWGAAGGVAAATGPVLGGLLISSMGWRLVFWVNVPVVAVATVLTLRHTANPPPKPRRRMDVPGQVLAVISLCLLTFAVIEGAHGGWDLPTILVLIAGIVCSAGFCVIENRSSDPMLPLVLFARPSFSISAVVGIALNFGFFGQLFALTLYFQQQRGYGPLGAGLALAPQAVSAIVGSPLGGRMSSRIGAFRTMAIGLTIGGCGLLSLLVVDATTPYPLIAVLTFIVGFGMSMAMPAATPGAVSSAPNAYTGIAGGVINSARQTGSVFGIAILGGLVTTGVFAQRFDVAVLLAATAFFGAALLTIPAIRTR